MKTGSVQLSRVHTRDLVHNGRAIDMRGEDISVAKNPGPPDPGSPEL